MASPNRAEFVALAQRGNLIPVWREVLADLETPVSAFLKLAHDRPQSFLLESVAGGEQLARYSFLGTDPRSVFRSKGLQGEIREGDRVERVTLTPGQRDPLHVLESLLGRYRHVPSPHLPSFAGGAVGMIAYDTVRFFERVPEIARDDLALDDCIFVIADTLLLFDHVRHRMLSICNVHVEEGEDPGAAFDRGMARANAQLERLKRVAPPVPAPSRPQNAAVFVSNRTEEDFKAAVLRAQEHVTAGDTFQVQVSQRLSKPLYAHPFDVYRALRSVNPSPYMFYLDFGDTKLVGTSPEVLASKEGRTVTMRPIAGTRHGRGATPAEDEAIAQDLLADEKERAEHIMLVDLARNDIGRVAEYGSVKVNELMVVEKYSHVMHLVSEVVGTLKEGTSTFDLLRASFPAGTLTGAPKVKTMEIIEKLEPSRRGAYGGGIGYFSFSGDMICAITIRTALVKDGMIHLQAAGGVVADSVPDYELRETFSKMRALTHAVAWAETGLEALT